MLRVLLTLAAAAGFAPSHSSRRVASQAALNAEKNNIFIGDMQADTDVPAVEDVSMDDLFASLSWAASAPLSARRYPSTPEGT